MAGACGGQYQRISFKQSSLFCCSNTFNSKRKLDIHSNSQTIDIVQREVVDFNQLKTILHLLRLLAVLSVAVKR